MVAAISAVMLYVAFLSVTALLVIYGSLQPWWRSWFGISMVLILGSLWQIEARAMLTTWLGESYPGREWVLLLGRMEIAVGTTIAVIGLGRQLITSWRATRRPETDRWSPRDHFGGS